MKQICALVLIVGLIAAACGGDDDTSSNATAESSDPTTAAGSNGGGSGGSGASGGSGGASGGGGGASAGGSGATGGGGSTPLTPIGPVAVNTIQIGDTTWNRTLPMTQGQCVVFKADGTLPDSAITWGPLDGDDDIRFSANQRQDGTFESEVRDDNRIFWIAGPRSPGVDDLEIELDFDALTVIGEGTYTSILGESLPGSFHIQCLPEDQ